jgi:seryl-tRNA synthetase
MSATLLSPWKALVEERAQLNAEVQELRRERDNLRQQIQRRKRRDSVMGQRLWKWEDGIIDLAQLIAVYHQRYLKEYDVYLTFSSAKTPFVKLSVTDGLALIAAWREYRHESQ